VVDSPDDFPEGQGPTGDARFQGVGAGVTEVFTMEKGLAVFLSLQQGSTGDLIVHILDTASQTVGIVTVAHTMMGPEAEARTITTAVNIPASGEYRLQVLSDGDWALNFTQPKTRYRNPAATTTLFGHYQQATRLFSLKAGQLHFTLHGSSGTSTFRVTLWDQEGPLVDQAANAAGAVDMAGTLRVPADGVYLLQVEYGGDWTIVITQSTDQTTIPLDLTPGATIGPPPTPPPTATLPLATLPISAKSITVSASDTAPDGTNACDATTNYAVDNVKDGDPTTAWRVLGDGRDQSIKLTFPAPARVTELRMVIGYAKVDPCDNTDRWPQGYRASVVDLTFSNGTTERHALADTRDLQSIILRQPVTTDWVQVIIRETRAPTQQAPRPYAAISEIVVVAAQP